MLNVQMPTPLQACPKKTHNIHIHAPNAEKKKCINFKPPEPQTHFFSSLSFYLSLGIEGQGWSVSPNLYRAHKTKHFLELGDEAMKNVLDVYSHIG